jgi:thiamine-monophosphate kinase
MSEFDLIARYFSRPTQRADVALGVGDDAAVLDMSDDRELVAAVDTIVEGVHFPVDCAPEDIGYRALAVNLSDIAAMGAEPRWMTLALTLPRADESWIARFAAGLYELADKHGVALVGGDTCKGPLVISVQILGSVERAHWLARNRAVVGDGVYVSGVPGEAAAGLALFQSRAARDANAEHLIQRFLRPEPRIALGRGLRGIASAAMDVSDGVVADLGKLCAASRCGARIDADSLPKSSAMEALFASDQCRDFALSGGDDYELLFTVPAAKEGELASHSGSILCTRIGEIVAGGGVECFSQGRKLTLARTGFDHFGDGV